MTHRTFPLSLRPLAAATALFVLAGPALADEHLFGWARGSETLPQGHFDAYQFITLRTGKDEGLYRGWDFDTEVEYGITDRFQVGISVEQHYFKTKDVPDLPNMSTYRFGGLEVSAKYRVLSPFKDKVGLALRLEGGYLWNDDVAGLYQQEMFIDPEVILHKNFFDDTLIFHLNGGMQFAWGKKPAEEYDYEYALHANAGVSYRFAPNWFIGFEARFRAEYPEFDIKHFEHRVVFIGPSLHYAAKSWWATASYGYQVYGKGIDEPLNGKTFAEETRNEFRLKVGLNF